MSCRIIQVTPDVEDTTMITWDLKEWEDNPSKVWETNLLSNTTRVADASHLMEWWKLGGRYAYESTCVSYMKQLDFLSPFNEIKLLITPTSQITKNVPSLLQKENTWTGNTKRSRTMAEFLLYGQKSLFEIKHIYLYILHIFFFFYKNEVYIIQYQSNCNWSHINWIGGVSYSIRYQTSYSEDETYKLNIKK